MLKLKGSGGFTLIELSIVIVIIGLIVAGIVGGQALVRQGKIQAQIAQFQQYKLAYNAFKLEYDAIPGDFEDASDYWPVADGDGNRRLTHDADYADDVSRENLKFFHHLSSAGLIPYNYDGTWEINKGYPEMKLEKGKGIVAAGLVRSAPNSDIYHQISELTYKAGLFLNVANPLATVSSTYNTSGTSTPRNYQIIDRKIDDGEASSGIFKAYRGESPANGNCLTGLDGDYLITNDRNACSAMYILDK